MGVHEALSSTTTRAPIILSTFFIVLFILFAGYANEQARRFRLAQWSPAAQASANANIRTHPIPQLMHNAEIKFHDLMQRQSKTLEDAVTEYQRRYKKDPPKGFDDWFRFAQEHNATIIDEYDGLMEDLEPFTGMSGAELRRRVDQARGPEFSCAVEKSVLIQMTSLGWDSGLLRSRQATEWDYGDL